MAYKHIDIIDILLILLKYHCNAIQYCLHTEQVLAPGYKGRAKFKFFAEDCDVRKNSLHDIEQQLSPILVGESSDLPYLPYQNSP